MSTATFGNAPFGVTSRTSVHVSRVRLRLTKRGRAVLMTLAATPVIVVALVVGLNGGGAFASLDAPATSFEYVTIESGQSLWQVAESLAPNADPRDVIDAIVRFNQLTSSDVLAGQRIAIPTQFSR